MAALILVACMSHTKQYLGLTWSLWLACLSFLFAPFWFNPLSFHWGKVAQDYRMWLKWMNGVGGNSTNSWEVRVWWREENSYISKFSLSQKLQGVIKPMVYLMIGVGIGGPKVIDLDEDEITEFSHLGLLALAMLLGHYITDKCGGSMSPWLRRSSKLVISSFALIYGAILLCTHTKYIRVAIGLYYIIAALSIVGVLLGISGVRHAYHVHDFVLGNILFLVLILLSALQFPSTVQTWLLFHNALSEGVVIEDILKYARMSKEQAGAEDADDVDLKRLVHAQARELEYLKARIVASGGDLVIGIPPENGGGESSPGSLGTLNSTMSGGFSFQPLAGDGGTPGSNRAEMMRASRSTMELTELAHTGSSTVSPGASSSSFAFSSPADMPPRD
ncbi:unnamed protein product [Discosporangium mesarthrocarpum]